MEGIYSVQSRTGLEARCPGLQRPPSTWPGTLSPARGEALLTLFPGQRRDARSVRHAWAPWAPRASRDPGECPPPQPDRRGLCVRVHGVCARVCLVGLGAGRGRRGWRLWAGCGNARFLFPGPCWPGWSGREGWQTRLQGEMMRRGGHPFLLQEPKSREPR